MITSVRAALLFLRAVVVGRTLDDTDADGARRNHRAGPDCGQNFVFGIGVKLPESEMEQSRKRKNLLLEGMGRTVIVRLFTSKADTPTSRWTD